MQRDSLQTGWNTPLRICGIWGEKPSFKKRVCGALKAFYLSCSGGLRERRFTPRSPPRALHRSPSLPRPSPLPVSQETFTTRAARFHPHRGVALTGGSFHEPSAERCWMIGRPFAPGDLFCHPKGMGPRAKPSETNISTTPRLLGAPKLRYKRFLISRVGKPIAGAPLAPRMVGGIAKRPPYGKLPFPHEYWRKALGNHKTEKRIWVSRRNPHFFGGGERRWRAPIKPRLEKRTG